MTPAEHSADAASPVRILVAHADPFIAAGVAFLCEAQPDFVVEREIPGASKTGEHSLSATFDVVITGDTGVSEWMPGATRGRASLAKRGPRVVVISPLDSGWQVRQIVEQGVHGYLHQACSAQELCTGIRAVHHGRRYITQLAAQCIASGLTQEPLSAREMAVLALIGRGLCNKTIGKELGISAGTVKAHVKAILSKLSAGSRTEAVAVASRTGLLASVPSASVHTASRLH
jgi:DNA-binding NarL/FixJ family response regulator